jgi:hypothetical protein
MNKSCGGHPSFITKPLHKWLVSNHIKVKSTWTVIFLLQQYYLKQSFLAYPANPVSKITAAIKIFSF